MPPTGQLELLGLDLEELTGLVRGSGEPSYRARQLFDALYGQRVAGLEEVLTLPAAFRALLNERSVSVGLPRIKKKFQSQDGTVRYLMGFADGQSVETVWMPEGDDGETGDGSEAGALEAAWWERATICVSSQAGCAVDCQFCLTALLGLQRNLSAGEIVGQVLAVLNDQGVALDRRRVNRSSWAWASPS